jgi:hypothetical protein
VEEVQDDHLHAREVFFQPVLQAVGSVGQRNPEVALVHAHLPRRLPQALKRGHLSYSSPEDLVTRQADQVGLVVAANFGPTEAVERRGYVVLCSPVARKVPVRRRQERTARLARTAGRFADELDFIFGSCSVHRGLVSSCRSA